MKRKIMIGLLAVGAIGGFGSGFAHLAHARHHGRERAADICVDAAFAAARGQDPAAAAGADHRWERHVAAMCADAARHRATPTTGC